MTASNPDSLVLAPLDQQYRVRIRLILAAFTLLVMIISVHGRKGDVGPDVTQCAKAVAFPNKVKGCLMQVYDPPWRDL